MPQEIVVTPIGVIHNAIIEAKDDIFGGTTSRIELDANRFTPEALTGLTDYSHVEIVFYLHGVPDSAINLGARHPRGRSDWPEVGIFAQRAKNRPNRIGVTVCKLRGVHRLVVEVEDLDAINGTPVLDIKPYVAEFGPRGPVRQPEWATSLMSGYWKRMD
jgi:tRNA-Thr(GGU) m(6)t(6)A37 methyltransferase TsaA